MLTTIVWSRYMSLSHQPGGLEMHSRSPASITPPTTIRRAGPSPSIRPMRATPVSSSGPRSGSRRMAHIRNSNVSCKKRIEGNELTVRDCTRFGPRNGHPILRVALPSSGRTAVIRAPGYTLNGSTASNLTESYYLDLSFRASSNGRISPTSNFSDPLANPPTLRGAVLADGPVDRSPESNARRERPLILVIKLRKILEHILELRHS